MNRIAGRCKILFLFGGILLLGLVIFLGEFLFQADDWVVFPGSPHVYRGVNLDCGTIVDRNGELLLDASDGREYSEDPDLRAATLHLLGDRDGYISAPALSGFSSEMAGFDLINGLYTLDGKQGTAILTVSAEVQLAAQEAMDGRKGVVAVYNYETGEILCALSAPNYDPDDVPDVEGDEDYDGVYVNRFTQATYTPGSIFKIATTAAALDAIDDIRDQSFYCEGSTWIEGDEVVCSGIHGTVDLKEGFMESCNVVFADVATQLGADKLQHYAEEYQILDPLEFDGIRTAEGSLDLSDAQEVEIAWAGIGQYTDQVNPARYLAFMGQIAGGGMGAQPYLVQEVSSGMLSSYKASTHNLDRIMPAALATELQEMMRYNVIANYGDENFPDIQVCAKSGTAERGEGLESNAMFSGFTLDENYPLAFITIVEGGGSGRNTCTPIVAQVLEACIDVMDAER